MTLEAQGSTNGELTGTTEESALGRILESYLAGLEAGRPADAEGLIADHPDLAGPLRTCLKVMHLAAGLSESAGCDRNGTTDRSGPTMVRLRSELPSRLLLPDPPSEDAPIVRVGLGDPPEAPNGLDAERYHILGEIARGGMGIVLRAHDVGLGRDLAVKVLQSRHRGDSGIVGRFVEEARIGGQLQHPGIVPVHELGTLSDHRPYFTMKLVKGRTLAALLAERPSPSDSDLSRFLTIFEQVGQTVAYAHARRVIHRDLKPANVMVGSFGEVQVVDWGLAKVLAEGGIADEARALERETWVSTDRGGPSGSDVESQPGSVFGTPSYMAPEQARGDLNQVDERADVFGLGAILCEILTGRPPYEGTSREVIRARATRGDLAPAMARLEGCGADAELIALARDCLAADHEQRPRNAGEVARRMSAYQDGVRDRLRAAELARVEAQTRAEEERKRRKVTVALAASVLALVVLGGAGWTYLARQRAERLLRIEVAMARVESLYEEARRGEVDPSRWIAAREAARSLDGLRADAPDATTRAGLVALVQKVIGAADAADLDRDWLAHLAEIRDSGAYREGRVYHALYEEAFRKAGIDLATMSPAEAGAAIASRPPSVRIDVAAALDFWARILRIQRHDPAGAARIEEVARIADPDPWRCGLRAVLTKADAAERRILLSDLARSARFDEWPVVSVESFGTAMFLSGAPEAESVLRRAVRRFPGNARINYMLARLLESRRPEEAFRYYMAARSLHPLFGHELGHAFLRAGEDDQAIAVFEDLEPSWPRDSTEAIAVCLARALEKRGRTREAREALGRAEVALREAVTRHPDSTAARSRLGHVLFQLGKWEDAIAAFGVSAPPERHNPQAHALLGIALNEYGWMDEAIAESREAIRLDPSYSLPHDTLGVIWFRQNKWKEATAEFREAVRLHPDAAGPHSHLGRVLGIQGDPEGEIAEYREALRLDPDHAESHYKLGSVLLARGQYAEALAELSRGHERGSKKTKRDWSYPSAELVRRAQRFVEIEEQLPAILDGKRPTADADESLAVAQLSYRRKLYAASSRFWYEAFRSDPKLAETLLPQHRYNAACAAAMAGCGQGKDVPPLDEAARARWRQQAVEWLKADLAAWSRDLETGSPQRRKFIAETHRHWKSNPNLAGIRDPAAIEKLPEDERAACRALWKDVDDLLAKTGGPAVKGGSAPGPSRGSG